MYRSLTIKAFDLLALHQYNPERYPCLLESSAKHSQLGQFSFLFAFPQTVLVLNDIDEFDFFAEFARLIKIEPHRTPLPFIGGWFVFLAYDMNVQIETVLRASMPRADLSQPLAYVLHIAAAVIIDHQKDCCYLVDECADGRHIEAMLADIEHIKNVSAEKISGVLFEDSEADFLHNVKKCQKYIMSGDIFQANLSRSWRFELAEDLPASAIYHHLRRHNPADFSALACFQGYEIISSSPERLFKVEKDRIETRPIAGTAAKFGNQSRQININKLKHSPKEQAEHIMLVDLERNDLGRVCHYGSIEVNELMTVESLAFVHHLVSNIRGRLCNHIGAAEIIKSLFPGGSITGCPKVRCMQIISELEGLRRGAYTGSLGYISRHGRMDFNILIRSFSKQKQNLFFRTGAGIVFDSDAHLELAETYYKAKGLLAVFD